MKTRVKEYILNNGERFYHAEHKWFLFWIAYDERVETGETINGGGYSVYVTEDRPLVFKTAKDARNFLSNIKAESRQREIDSEGQNIRQINTLEDI